MNLDGQYDDHLTAAKIIQGQQFERCGNCDCEFPEGTGHLVEVHNAKGQQVMNVCGYCAEPKKVYFTESPHSESLRYAATVYESNQMVMGFGPTEPAAIADLREKFAEQFDRDLLNFSRG